MRKRLAVGLFGVASVLFAGATPASAHGVGGREDLPLEFWQFAWAAAAAVLISFVGLVYFWPRSVLPRLAAGRVLPRTVDRAVAAAGVAARLVVLALAVLVTVAGFIGEDNLAVNVGPTAVYVMLWVGVLVAAAVFGVVWGSLSPYDTVGWVFERLGLSPRRPVPEWAGWVGVGALGGFMFLELCYHNGPSPRTLGWAIVVYSAVMVSGVVAYGRDWLRQADGFSVLFDLVARLAPLGREPDGRLRLRVPTASLSTVDLSTPAAVAIIVVLGGTTFDGFSGSNTWFDLVGQRTGWEATIAGTLGLLWITALVGILYVGGCRAIARSRNIEAPEAFRAFGHSLVPIVVGYAVAHYFSLFAWRIQTFIARLSDPFGDGSDWFGTSDLSVNPAPFSNATIAWVQVFAIVGGHVAGVVIAHDRAVERWDTADAVRSQYVMLGVMVVYSVVGLWLLMAA